MLACAAALAGCQESADSFFSGRPSGMGMLAAVSRLSPTEMQQLESWLAAIDKTRSARKNATLEEIRVAIAGTGS